MSRLTDYLPILAFIAYWALALVQLAGFFEGLHTAGGWPFLGAFIAWVVCMMLGPIGAVAMMIFVFIGAKDGWGWEWWQAAMLAAPFLLLQIGLIAVGGGIDMMGRSRRRAV